MQVLLKIECLQKQSIKDCLHNIKSNIIFGRNAIYCISEIRFFIISVFSESINDKKSDCIEFLHELFYICMNPFLLSSTYEESTNCAIFLELAPVIFGCLTNNHSTLDNNEYRKPLIDFLLQSDWNTKSLVLIFNLMSELYIYFSPKHLKKIQVKSFSKIILYKYFF